MCAVPCSKQTPTSTYRLDVHLSSGLACRFSEGFAVALQMSILGTHGSNRALTQPMTVTAAGRDAITELNGRAAMDEVRLCMMFQPPADRLPAAAEACLTSLQTSIVLLPPHSMGAVHSPATAQKLQTPRRVHAAEAPYPSLRRSTCCRSSPSCCTRAVAPSPP